MKKKSKHQMKVRAMAKKQAKMLPVSAKTEFERFDELLKTKYGVKDKWHDWEYETLKAAEKAKGRKVSAEKLAKYIAQEGYTDKQIKARLDAARRLDPTVSRRSFMRNRTYREIDMKAEELYATLKIQYPELSTGEISHLIGQQLYGSE